MMNAKSESELVTDFVEFVHTSVQEPLLVLVSGGSLLPVLQKGLHELMMLKLDLSQLTFSLIDERFGEDDPMNTNFYHLQMLHEVPMLEKQGAKFVPILREGMDLQSTTEQYEKFLQTWAEGPTQKILGILGLGEDFHTAGILAHKPEFDAQFYQKLAVGYSLDDFSNSDDKYRQRITLSFKGMQILDEVWLYAAGEHKQQVVSELKQEVGKQHTADQISAKPGLFLADLPQLVIYS